LSDTLLATNAKSFLYEVKQFFSTSFDMKDMGDTSYIIALRFKEIELADFSSNINKVLEKFRMKDYSPIVAPGQ
jgi:hypothetical protein